MTCRERVGKRCKVRQNFMLLWSIQFLVVSLFCAWIVFGNGADATEGLFAAMYLGADFRWSEQGIKIFVAASWGLVLVWYLVGVFVPEFRLGLLV